MPYRNCNIVSPLHRQSKKKHDARLNLCFTKQDYEYLKNYIEEYNKNTQHKITLSDLVRKSIANFIKSEDKKKAIRF
jgi:UDP-N-acetylglucosamine 2-epimerase